MSFLIAALVFATVSLLVLSAYRAATAESPLARRLRTMVPGASSSESSTSQRPSLMYRLLAILGGYSFGSGGGTLGQTLSSAGYRSPNAIAVFLGARMLVSFGPAVLIVLSRLSRTEAFAQSMLVAGVAWAVGHLAANLWLRRRSRWRIGRLSEGLPDCLDLMVVCLESGLGLNATIARVGEERSALDDPLGNEFAQVAFELRSGRTREEALRGLGDRNGFEDLKALAGIIIQSDKLGASMSKTLHTHADFLRVKRRQRVEEQARKLPVKVLFPLATLMLPPLFIMMVGPAFLRLGELVRLITQR